MSKPSGREGPTPRQAEIVGLVAEGLGDKEIARKLGISPNTVRTHLQRLYRDQDVTNRAAAAIRFAAFRPGRRNPRRDWPGPAGGALAGLVVGIIAAAALAVPSAIAAFRIAAVPPPRVAPAEAEVATSGPPSPALAAAPSTPPSHLPTPVPEAATPAPPPTPRPAPPLSVSAPTVAAALRQLPSTGVSPADAARAELDQINAARASHGLPPLIWDDCLATAASTAAAKAAAAGFISPDPAAPDPCRPGLAATVGAYWPTPDDAAATRVLLADPARAAIVLSAHLRMGAAWAVGSTAAFLVIEMD